MSQGSQIIQRRSLRVGRCPSPLLVIGMPGLSDRHAPESAIGMRRNRRSACAGLRNFGRMKNEG